MTRTQSRRTPTIKDVAELAGVSISTVSNTIHATKPVSEELRERILAAIRELDYSVDPVARSLKSKTTMTLGVIIPNINRVFFTQVLRGVQDYCSQLGYNLTLCHTEEKLEREKHFIQMLRSSWADGIILGSVANDDDSGYLQRLAELGGSRKRIPVVSMERDLSEFGLDSVAVDNVAGGRMATRHLIDCGCRRIAHITGPMFMCMVAKRVRGYQLELAANDLTADPLLVVNGDFSPQSGYDAMQRLLDSAVAFDGVYAANDQMAIGAIKALRERGIAIPAQVKVIGYDNTFIASIVEPSLSTIHVPKYRMGQMVSRLLVSRIQNGAGSPQISELPIELIIRHSTDPNGQGMWDLAGW